MFSHISPFNLWFINWAWGLLQRQRHQSGCSGRELFSHVRRTIYCISHKLSRNRQINKCWFDFFLPLFCLYFTLFLISQPDRPSLHLLWFITLGQASHFTHKRIYFTHTGSQFISWLVIHAERSPSIWLMVVVLYISSYIKVGNFLKKWNVVRSCGCVCYFRLAYDLFFSFCSENEFFDILYFIFFLHHQDVCGPIKL